MSVQSVRRVSLAWPITPMTGTPLSEIETLFHEWIREARRRGCPDTAAVSFPVAPFPGPSLIVQWDAADDVRPEEAGDGAARTWTNSSTIPVADLVPVNAKPETEGGPPRCPAHANAACPDCSLNDGPTCDGCGYFEATGVHWDTCPNRRCRPPAP